MDRDSSGSGSTHLVATGWGQASFRPVPGGRADVWSPPRGAPRGRLGRPWRRPVSRRRRARIASYLQCIVAPTSPAKGHLRPGLATMRHMRRARIPAYLQRLVVPKDSASRFAAYLQRPVKRCRGRRGEAKTPIGKTRWTDDAEPCIFTVDPDLPFSARRTCAVAVALTEIEGRWAGD